MKSLAVASALTWPFDGYVKKLKCDACIVAAELARPVPREWTKAALVGVATPACEYLNGTGWCSKTTLLGDWSCADLCQGMMNTEADVLLDLLETHGPSGMCGGVGVCPRPQPAGPPEPATPVVKSDLSDLRGEKQWASWKKPSGTFVHFTDLHLQLDYAAGTMGDTWCGQPVCCRPEQPPLNGTEGVGLYGGEFCDMTPTVFKAMVDAIHKLDPRPDFIINTGDDPAHVVWEQTHASQTEHMRNVSQSFFDAGFGDVPFVQILGNHEAHPVDQYRVPLSLDNWLYQGAMQEAWGPWLTDDAKRTIGSGGIYTQRLMPGLRAIVMHTTQYESGDNWFFEADARDTQGQMLWFVDALEQARQRGEKVLVLRHHPYGSMDKTFSDMIRNATESYNDIIIATLVGHVHVAWLTALRDRATGTKALSVEYGPGGSGPDQGTLNPTFRVYKYDTSTYELLDYDQYALDYRAANKDASNGVFRKILSAKSEFELKDISAAEWSRVAKSWLGNTSQANTTWERFAGAVTRHRLPASSQNRRGKACQILMADSTPTPDCGTSGDASIDASNMQLGKVLAESLTHIDWTRVPKQYSIV